MIYILSCETIERGGGIYAFDYTESDGFKKQGYLLCDRPMYAVKCEQGLCVLLRQPFDNSDESGYFYIDESLQNPTQIKSTKGKCACHLCLGNNDVYIVNYLSGNIVKNGETVVQRTGRSTNLIRQTYPHPHFIEQTLDGYLSVCDLGTDTLATYDKDLHVIGESKVPSGYGIRHLVFSKDGKYIYAINEIVPSISVFLYNNGQIIYVHSVKIDCKNEKANGAAIRLSKDGKYIYISLREENVICIFAVDGENLTLLQTLDCGGDSPRDFDISDNHLIVCNEKSGNVVSYVLKDGLYHQKHSNLKIPAPLCCVISPK